MARVAGQRRLRRGRAAEAAARRSYGKLVACLAAQTRDVAAAEDALADAFASALERLAEDRRSPRSRGLAAGGGPAARHRRRPARPHPSRRRARDHHADRGA